MSDCRVASPVTGELLPLQACSDPLFSEGSMGDGFVVVPEDGTVVAPVSGTVSMVFESAHAYGITTDAGVEVLVHVGLDTVELGGAPFAPRVRQGDKIGAGDKLVSADFEMVRSAGKSCETMVLFPETLGRSLEVMTRGSVVAGQEVAALR